MNTLFDIIMRLVLVNECTSYFKPAYTVATLRVATVAGQGEPLKPQQRPATMRQGRTEVRPTMAARAKFVKIRTTDAEREAWQTLADDAGLSLADLIRQRLDQPVLQPPKTERVQRVVIEADPDLILQLSKIGNNLNQLARAVNTAGLEPQDVTTVLTYLSGVAADLTAIRKQAQAEAATADLSDEGVMFGTR